MSGPFQNTDCELWRGPSRAPWGDEDRFYADSIHVTQGGGIGIDCGGHVIVKPVRVWFAAMQEKMERDEQIVRALRWHNPPGWHFYFERLKEGSTLALGPVYVESGPRCVVERGAKPILQWRAR